MTTLHTDTPSIGTFLTTGDPHVDAPSGLWGFGGLHGGLALARLAATMGTLAPQARLRSVHGTFHRSLRDPFDVDAAQTRAGTTLVASTARATVAGTAHLTASATFAATTTEPWPELAPSPPPAPPPEDCDTFRVPAEFVPIAAHTEIRPVGPNRPYAAGATPELTAWVRIADEHAAPDPLRLVFLADALAPSYAALLSEPLPIPTIELSVHLTDNTVPSNSPWVLLAARTHAMTPSGWIDEYIDLWASDSTHLASARQLRRAPTPREDSGAAPPSRQ